MSDLRGTKPSLPNQSDWKKYNRVLGKLLSAGIGAGILESFKIEPNSKILYRTIEREETSYKLPPLPRLARSLFYLARNVINLESSFLPYILNDLRNEHQVEDFLFCQLFTSQTSQSSDLGKLQIDTFQLYRHYSDLEEHDLCKSISLANFCKEYDFDRKSAESQKKGIKGKETLYLPTTGSLILYELMMVYPKLYQQYMFIFQSSNNAQSKGRKAYNIDLFSPNEACMWLGVALNKDRLRTLHSQIFTPKNEYFKSCYNELEIILGNDISFLYEFLNPLTSIIVEHWMLTQISEELSGYILVDEERDIEIETGNFKKRNFQKKGFVGISYNLIFKRIENDKKMLEDMASELFGVSKGQLVKAYP